MAEAHRDDMDIRAQTPGISPEEIQTRIQIQTKLELIKELIEDNERFHGFWALWWNKIPNFSDTEERLEAIHKKLQDPEVKLWELETLDDKLGEIIREFMIIMRWDEEFIAQELREWMAYMSQDDISMIQEYMRECLELIDSELSMSDTESDYLRTSGTDIDRTIRDFIREEDLPEARKYMVTLVDHFKKLSWEDSSLAFHHLAEIADKLRKGDNPEEIWAKYFGRAVGSGAALLLLITGIYILVKLTALINWWKAGARRARDLQRILQTVDHWGHQIFGFWATATIAGWNLTEPVRNKIQELIKPLRDKIRKLIQKLVQKIWKNKTNSLIPLDWEEIPPDATNSEESEIPPPLPPLSEEK